MLWILTALLMFLPATAWADDVEKAMRARVVLTTEPKAVESCALVGTVSDDSVKDLRKKIVRAGGDTGLLSFTSGDEVVARIFRCPSPQAVAPAVVPPTPATVAPPTLPAQTTSGNALPGFGVAAFGGGIFGGLFRVVFVHPTKTQEEQQRDLYECKRDSASVIYPIPGEDRTALGMRQRALIRECMSVRGYTER